MDWMVCSGYVTMVATAFARAPMMKNSTDDILGKKKEKSLYIMLFLHYVVELIHSNLLLVINSKINTKLFHISL